MDTGIGDTYICLLVFRYSECCIVNLKSYMFLVKLKPAFYIAAFSNTLYIYRSHRLVAIGTEILYN